MHSYGSTRLIVFLVLYRNQHTQEGHKSPEVRGIHLGDPLGVIYGGFRGPFWGDPLGESPRGVRGGNFCDFLFWVFDSFLVGFGENGPRVVYWCGLL